MKLDRVIAVRNNKTIYRNGEYCVKVFNPGYSKADVLNEALNHSRVEETGLNIPKILEVTTFDGKWALVFEYIKGKTLSQIMEENPEKKDEYIEFMVNLQLEVLAMSAPLLNRMKDKMNRKISMADIKATTRYDFHTKLEAMPQHTKVCHGDFEPSNIIIAENETPYIVDWAHATLGNASADAAKTYLTLSFNEDTDGAKKYLELFCKKTGTEKEYVKKWINLVAVAQSVDGNFRERKFLLSKADYID